MNWLWGSSKQDDPIYDVDIDAALGKLQHCSELQQQLVETVLAEFKQEISRKQQVFHTGDDESGQILVGRCVWACYHFKNNKQIVRNALEIINWAIRPAKSIDATSAGGVNYLHLVYSGVLFDAFQKGTDNTKKNLHILFDLFSIPDSFIRYNCLTILHTLILNNKVTNLQGVILTDPMVVNTLVELLDDDADELHKLTLIFLLALTETQQEELQKLIAFSGAFEKTFGIIDTGSAWAENINFSIDCLKFIKNLLKNNVSNQNYFRETSCVHYLLPFLEFDSSDTWLLTDQKISLILPTFDIVIILLSGSNPSIHSNQSEMGKKTGIIDRIISWGLDRINSAEVRSKALIALGRLLRNHQENRGLFSQKLINIARERTPQPTLHRLLTLAFHSNNLSERISAFFAFQNFLYENQESQLAFVSTLTPPPDSSGTGDVTDPHAGANSIGRQLLSAFTDTKNASHCFLSSSMLAAILSDNSDCKQFALRVKLYLDSSENLLTVSMKQLKFYLIERPQQQQQQRESQANPNAPSAPHTHNGAPAGAVQSSIPHLQAPQQPLQVSESIDDFYLAPIGILRLFCYWMFEFPNFVKEFLSIPDNLGFFIENVLQPEGNVHFQGICALIIGFCFMFNKEVDQTSSSSRSTLYAIICHRIGFDKFIDKIQQLLHSNLFIRSQKFEWEKYDKFSDFIYDPDFIEFIKKSYDQLQRELRSPNKRDNAHENQLKEKDKQIELLNQKISELEETIKNLSAERVNIEQNSQLNAEVAELNKKIAELQFELDTSEKNLQNLSFAYNQLESTLNSMQGADPEYSTPSPFLSSENNHLENEENQSASEKDKMIEALQEQLAILLKAKENENENEKILLKFVEENDQLTKQLEELTSKFEANLQENTTLNNKVDALSKEVNTLTEKTQAVPTTNDTSDEVALKRQLQLANSELENYRIKCNTLEKQQEELLILLAQEELKNMAR